MTYKTLQLFPHAGTRVTAPFIPPTDMGFLQSWFGGGTRRDDDTQHRHINWGAILGLALSLALSATFWAGLVWMIARISR